MEGYLIRVPSRAWGVGSDDDSATKKKKTSIKRHRNSVKPQAKLLYYILGEGYLEGYASPEDVEPVETFRLTSFNVHVEPIYSMQMFRVTTSAKRSIRQPPAAQFEEAHSSSSDDDDDDDDDDEASRAGQDGLLVLDSVLLFAGDRALVEKWCQKIHNWNRYVFAGGADDATDAMALATAKRDLVAAFADKMARGLFSSPCDLVDCTRSTETAAQPTPLQLAPSPSTVDGPPPPAPVSVDKPSDAAKATEIKPLWMLLTRGPSHRVSAVPFPK